MSGCSPTRQTHVPGPFTKRFDLSKLGLGRGALHGDDFHSSRWNGYLAQQYLSAFMGLQPEQLGCRPDPAGKVTPMPRYSGITYTKWTCDFAIDAIKHNSVEYDVTSVTKVSWDESAKASCCAGTQDRPDLWCDPTWCPSDPAGACAGFLQQRCSVGLGTECNKAAMLVTGDPCHSWYLAQRDGATGDDGRAAVAKAVETFCDTFPAHGECACAKAVKATGTGGTGGAAAAAAAGGAAGAAAGGAGVARLVTARVGHDGSASGQRMDVYCIPGTGTDKLKAARPDLHAKFCEPAAASVSAAAVVGAGALLAQPALPVSGSMAAGGGVAPLPAHCYLPDCMGDMDTQVLFDPLTATIPCPNVCAQTASGLNLDLDNVSAQRIVAGGVLEACNFGNAGGASGALATPFAVDLADAPAAFVAVVPAGTVDKTRRVPVRNVAADVHDPSAAVVRWTAASTAPGIVTVASGASASGSAPGGSAFDVDVDLDATDLTPGTLVPVAVVVSDASGANGPMYAYINLHVSEAGGGGGASPTVPQSEALPLRSSGGAS